MHAGVPTEGLEAWPSDDILRSVYLSAVENWPGIHAHLSAGLAAYLEPVTASPVKAPVQEPAPAVAADAMQE